MGSEMCIRDSFNPAVSTAVVLFENRRDSARAFVDVERCIRPVFLARAIVDRVGLSARRKERKEKPMVAELSNHHARHANRTCVRVNPDINAIRQLERGFESVRKSCLFVARSVLDVNATSNDSVFLLDQFDDRVGHELETLFRVSTAENHHSWNASFSKLADHEQITL